MNLTMSITPHIYWLAHASLPKPLADALQGARFAKEQTNTLYLIAGYILYKYDTHTSMTQAFPLLKLFEDLALSTCNFDHYIPKKGRVSKGSIFQSLPKHKL